MTNPSVLDLETQLRAKQILLIFIYHLATEGCADAEVKLLTVLDEIMGFFPRGEFLPEAVKSHSIYAQYLKYSW